jgi:hypothetical protein
MIGEEEMDGSVDQLLKLNFPKNFAKIFRFPVTSNL